MKHFCLLLVALWLGFATTTAMAQPAVSLTQTAQPNLVKLLPARIAGGSGAQHPARNLQQGISGGFELDKIKPGMSKEEHDRVRQEIARLASQMLRGL